MRLNLSMCFCLCVCVCVYYTPLDISNEDIFMVQISPPPPNDRQIIKIYILI